MSLPEEAVRWHLGELEPGKLTPFMWIGRLSGKPGASLVSRWYRICLQCRRPGSIPGLGRSAAEGNGNPLQYVCLESSMDRGA